MMKTSALFILSLCVCALPSCKEGENVQSNNNGSSTEAAANRLSNDTEKGAEEASYVLHSRDFLLPEGCVISQNQRLEMDLTSTIKHAEHAPMMNRSENIKEVEASITVQKDGVLKAKVLKSQMKSKISPLNPDGEVRSNEENGPLLGKTIKLQPIKGVFVPSLTDEKSNPEAIAALEEWSNMFHLNKSDEMFGDTPRKVGDKWDVKMSSLPTFKVLEAEQDEKITIKFHRIVDINGVECALLMAPFKVDLRKEGEDEDQVNVVDGTVKIYHSIKHCINMKVRFDASVELTNGEKDKMQVVSEGLISFEKTRTLKLP